MQAQRILISVFIFLIHLYQVTVSSPLLSNLLPIDKNNCTLIFLQAEEDASAASKSLLEEYKSHDKFFISFSNNLEFNLTKTFANNKKLIDVHQLGTRCIFALIQVSTTLLENIERFSEHLQYLTGIVKKDEDYFVFYSSTEKDLISIFSTGAIASGVKNKVGIKISSKNGTTATAAAAAVPPFYTTCFYCSYAGKPNLYEIKIENQKNMKQNGDAVNGNELSTFPKSILFPDQLQDFYGKVFKISYPLLARWLLDIRETSPGRWGYKRGVMNHAMEHIMYKYNFSGSYFPSIGGGGTGYRFANGTWIGTVGDVLSGRTEIGQCTGQIFNRNKVVGFSFPITYEWMTFTTGEPQPHYSWKSVYWPFTFYLWLAVIGSVIIAFFALTFVLRLTITSNSNSNSNGTGTGNDVSFIEKITFLLRTVLDQDFKGFEANSTHTLRIFLVFWFIFSLLITTSYRSKLVSFLAFPLLEEPPKTFLSLADSPNVRVVLQYIHGAAYSLLKTSTNPTFMTIFQKMELVESDAKCFQQAIGVRHYCCISWDAVADFVYHKNLSDKYGNVPLLKSQDRGGFIVVGLAFPKGSTFRMKFDSVLFWAMDMGLIPKWRELDFEFIRNERKLWERATNKSQIVYVRNTNDVLKMQNLNGTFRILILGILMGLAAALGEAFVFWWKTKFKSKSVFSSSSAFPSPQQQNDIFISVTDVHMLFQIQRRLH